MSFAFEDAVWCDWIYREFDGTRVPRPLAGRPSRHGTPYPERISVSPDPADPQQLENYADTLKIAQHLIVVVSPASTKEDMVQEHIRLFRASGGDERIIALVVKGEPASGSAEAGTAEDAQWLPKWLQWRFQNNRFEPAPPCEPLVVDARLGVSSLAEVRARLCAAMLEVPVTQLGELGVMIRSSTADFARQAAASPVIVSMPDPTPLPTLASFAVPEETPATKASRWPIFVCSAAALAAFGCLMLWPAKELVRPPTVPSINLKNPKPVEPPPATQLSSAQPLVALVAVGTKPEAPIAPEPVAPTPEPPIKASPVVLKQPEPVAPTPVVQTTPPAPAPVIAPANSTPPAPPAVAVQPVSSPNGTSGVVPATGPAPRVESGIPYSMTAEGEAAERKRYELASRRDRLIRLAESKVTSGDADEAIATFQQAVDTAHELVNRTDGGHDEVIELALLYRRFGNFAAGVNSTAEGRVYFDRGRRALQALRAKNKLPREAFKILGDLEAAAKTGTRE